MADERKSMHGEWSGRVAFVLAATGSAVGLGNIWKFPYITGENGGGAFVIVYLVCIVAIGVPVLMGEILLGRRGKSSPVKSVAYVAEEAGATTAWSGIGWMGVISGFLILSFYSVIAGWALAYIFEAATGAFTGATAEQVGTIFDDLTASPGRLILWSTIFMVATCIVVGRGVQKGIESAVTLLMPMMFILLLILVGYAMTTGHFREGLVFLFKPDFSELTANAVLIALGHAFFTLSLASGIMIAYGAYLPRRTSITEASVIVAIADTIVALLAGMAIFPIVFAYNLQPEAGPGLTFVTLPIAFGQMPFGALFGTLFFIMLAFAAFTSSISLIEPATSWLIEAFNFTRPIAAALAGFAIWLVGLGSVFSFNLIDGVHFLGTRNFFDTIDYITANIMLPLGGFFIAIFCAWIMKRAATKDELALSDGFVFRAWHFVMRYVAPVLILIAFLNLIGVLNLTPAEAPAAE